MDRRKFLGSSIAAAVAATVPARAEWEDVLYRPTKIESDLAAIKLDGSGFTLKQAEVQELSDSLKGKLWLSGSEAYDEARTLLEAGAVIRQASGVCCSADGTCRHQQCRSFREGP